VGELATALGCDRSNVSRLVDRASARGLIERTEADDDGRVSLVQLTPEGDKLATTFIAMLEAQLAPLLGRWPGQQQRTAVSVINEISDVLQPEGRSEPRRRPAPIRRPAE
jgi:DNA-binding MarR family transcriptional regulator